MVVGVRSFEDVPQCLILVSQECVIGVSWKMESIGKNAIVPMMVAMDLKQ